ncbi:MAG: 30S ribosome-binding factor RbfA [Clostridiales bacterium]|nr:30S ribosome-binding factor RbfA [Clostridiales bacterium]
MPNYRRGRINDEVAKEMAVILREIKDPRIQRNLVTVTACDVSADLKFAKIYYSVIGAGAQTEVKEALERAKGFIRSRLAASLNLRVTPALTFYYDESAEHGAHIMQLLKDIEESEPHETN